MCPIGWINIEFTVQELNDMEEWRSWFWLLLPQLKKAVMKRIKLNCSLAKTVQIYNWGKKMSSIFHYAQIYSSVPILARDINLCNNNKVLQKQVGSLCCFLSACEASHHQYMQCKTLSHVLKHPVMQVKKPKLHPWRLFELHSAGPLHGHSYLLIMFCVQMKRHPLTDVHKSHKPLGQSPSHLSHFCISLPLGWVTMTSWLALGQTKVQATSIAR